MSLRTGFLASVEVILRVPPLFVIDELLRARIGSAGQLDATSSVNNNETIYDMFINGNFKHYAECYKLLTLTFFKNFLCFLGYVSAICVFLLSFRRLFIVYIYALSIGIVFISYWANIFTMTYTMDAKDTQPSVLEDILNLNLMQFLNPSSVGFVIFANYFLQIILSSLFAFTYSCIGPKYSALNKALTLSFITPSALAIVSPRNSPNAEAILMHSPVFAALLPLAMIKFVLWYGTVTVVQTIHSGYEHSRNVIHNFGLNALVEAEWQRLRVPCILRTFWMLRVAEHAAALIMEGNYSGDSHSGLFGFSALLSMCKSLLTTGCETLTALLGMISVVSYICHYIGCFFQWILLTEDEDDKSIGTISAVLFYILSLQTGLTSLDPEKRFVRLGRNFCLLCTAVLHFIHNIVNPLLLSLSASKNTSLHRHVRALAVCLFLIVFPLVFLIYLWSDQTTSTWLLAVTAFSIEVIVKVIVSLALYVLFLIDAYRKRFWEQLDDYVYYIRAFGNTVEFFFGIFLFLNGAWILMFESGGTIRALAMCIHAYLNIWCEARAGWSSFMKRRTAARKINSLPEATTEELNEIEDLCAICFQEMKSAKITRCKHYFHGFCLRKWLYVQDRCPLCHDILYKE